MKWVEIITLRSLSNIDTRFLDELLREEDKPDTSKRPVEIRVYRNSIVETDLSIHIYWESRPGIQHKSPLGLKLFYALKDMGLLNHSAWVESAATEFVPLNQGDSKSRDRHTTE